MTRAFACFVALLPGLWPISAAAAGAGQIGGVAGGVVQAAQNPNAPARDQRPTTGNAVIRGHILTDTGQPLRRATVRLGNGPQGRTTVTDTDGRYEFRDVAAGNVTMTASKATYLTMAYGQTQPNGAGKPLTVAANQTLENIDIRLSRGGVITGRVSDEFGDPAPNVRVTLLRQVYTQGQRRMNQVGSASTNDIGEYRIFGLQPGQYMVSASAPPPVAVGPQVPAGIPINVFGPAANVAVEGDEGRAGYAPTYYPGTTDAASAAKVKVVANQTVSQIDITLQPTRLATISGTVVDSQGQPFTRGGITIQERSNVGIVVGAAGNIQQDGMFVLHNVPPGQYVLRATKPPAGPPSGGPPAPPEFSIAEVSVSGGDLSDVRLVPPRRVTLKGQLIFDDPTAAQAAASGMTRVSAQPANPTDAIFGGAAGPPPVVASDLTFAITTIAGQVVLRALGTRGQLKAVRVNGQDVTDTGLDATRDVSGITIEFTSRQQTVAGSVSDSRGQPIPDYFVAVFPQDRALWQSPLSRQLALVRPGQDGQFKNGTLPPGLYFAIALDRIDTGQWQDPDLLEGLSRQATPFSLPEGGTVSLDLKVFTLQ